jgi:hypothetical protein
MIIISRFPACLTGVLDRARSRLDIPALRTLFGLKNRPHRNRASGPPVQEIVIGKPQYGLSWFRIRFGLLQLKACTKTSTSCASRHRAQHQGAALPQPGELPEIITRLAGMADRFATTLDCADISFIADGTLDELPLPARIGATRTGGIDLNKPRIRAALAGTLALAAAPHGFTVAELTAKVRSMSGQGGYTSRQAAYDLRKLRGKGLAASQPASQDTPLSHPARHSPDHRRPLALRDHVLAPVIAGARRPRCGRKPAHWTAHRPGLRDPPHRHAGPLPRSGHRNASRTAA